MREAEGGKGGSLQVPSSRREEHRDPKAPAGALVAFTKAPLQDSDRRAAGDAGGMFIHLFEESSHFLNVLMANFSIAVSKKRNLITN